MRRSLRRTVKCIAQCHKVCKGDDGSGLSPGRSTFPWQSNLFWPLPPKEVAKWWKKVDMLIGGLFPKSQCFSCSSRPSLCKHKRPIVQLMTQICEVTFTTIELCSLCPIQTETKTSSDGLGPRVWFMTLSSFLLQRTHWPRWGSTVEAF